MPAVKHHTSQDLRALCDMIDDALKNRDVCGVCLAKLLLAGATETVRCLDPDQLDRIDDEIDRLFTVCEKPANAH